jgi:rhodanese-related sulfurtransferase
LVSNIEYNFVSVNTKNDMEDLINALKSDNKKIIDVRTPEEFMGGHVAGSINIPLNEIPNRLEEFKSISDKIILCCASGNRSGQAAYFLGDHEIDCINGGPWTQVNYLLNN